MSVRVDRYYDLQCVATENGSPRLASPPFPVQFCHMYTVTTPAKDMGMQDERFCDKGKCTLTQRITRHETATFGGSSLSNITSNSTLRGVIIALGL